MGIGDCPPRGPFAHYSPGVRVERHVIAVRKAGLARRAGKEVRNQATPLGRDRWERQLIALS